MAVEIFNLTAISDQVRACEPGSVWIPHLSLANGESQRVVANAAVEASPDGTVVYSEQFSATLTSPLSLRTFPFDRQTLPIVVQPAIEDRKTVELIPDGTRSAVRPQPWSALAEWRIGGLSTVARSRLPRGAGDGVTEIAFDLAVARQPSYYLWKLFLPLLIIVIISWSIFRIDTAQFSNQIGIAMTAILTVIAFSLAISSTLPRTPHLTLMDAFYLMSYVFVFLAITEVVTIHGALTLKRDALAHRIRATSQWAFPLAYVVGLGMLAVLFLAR